MLTTLCYIEKDNKYLMLHRTKKENDINRNKWLGVGGKFEKGETPEECLKREVKEETGLDVINYDFKGIVIFNYNDDEPLFMYLYTCKNFKGEIKTCDEGELKWIEKSKIFDLNLWEGDKIFLKLLDEERRFFYLTLDYENDNLINQKLEFKEDNFSYFEVFVPEDFEKNIIEALGKYSLTNEGFYSDVYASIDVVGHWTPLQGANPFDGEIGIPSVAKEKLLKFRVKKEFKELAYYLIKKAHPYEVPVINIF
ncbi:MAG: NUDIX domain-containing protein [Fusobacterium sp.]|nr:NUDIX domain-containing protein [Fusobacterium sp.]